MTKAELAQHLATSFETLYRREEFSPVLLILYTMLLRVVSDEATALVWTPARFVWFKDGVELGEFRIADLPERVDFREALEAILARDAVVRRHLQPVLAGPEVLAYSI